MSVFGSPEQRATASSTVTISSPLMVTSSSDVMLAASLLVLEVKAVDMTLWEARYKFSSARVRTSPLVASRMSTNRDRTLKQRNDFNEMQRSLRL